MATGCEDSASKKQKGAPIHLSFHFSGEPGQQALALRRATAEHQERLLGLLGLMPQRRAPACPREQLPLQHSRRSSSFHSRSAESPPWSLLFPVAPNVQPFTSPHLLPKTHTLKYLSVFIMRLGWELGPFTRVLAPGQKSP